MIRVVPSAVEISHFFLKKVVCTGDIVVDATAGNGHDTLFLAQLVGESGTVYAFDVQAVAIEKTKNRLQAVGLLERVRLINSDHQGMEQYISSPVKAVIFNLGYLPGGDHEIVTLPTSTCKAIDVSRNLLMPGGIICLVVYWGHHQGEKESEAICSYVSQLPQTDWDVMKLSFPNKVNRPPYVIVLQKKTGGTGG